MALVIVALGGLVIVVLGEVRGLVIEALSRFLVVHVRRGAEVIKRTHRL